ncbi:MAG: MFS transporter [Hyphomicrobiales bacterium]|nr:MFS transporter [Hyphomicrobiales bacterium]
MEAKTANGARAWSIAALLFFFSMVNFIDKLVIGLAAVPIMKEFGLTPSQFGKIGSSFFLLYAVSGVIVGLFIVQRASPKWLLAALVAIWTVAQAPVAFGGSVTALFAGRILLGVGEGPATPSAYHALYGWFTSEKRSLPTSVQLAGVGMGFLIGSPLLTGVIQSFGWRAGFGACAAFGLVWLATWLAFGADGPLVGAENGGTSDESRVPWGAFWSDRTIIANLVVATCAYWLTGLSITWLAPYLQMGLGYTPRDTGWLVSVILGAQIPLQLAIAWISHRLLHAGFGSRLARGMVLAACVIVAGAALAAATFVTSPTPKIVLLSLGFTLPTLAFIIGPTIVGETAPAAQRGTALLVTYSVITISALISPVLTGWVVEQAGATPLVGYTHALWLTSAILIFGGLWALVGLDPERTRARFAKSRS